jgi:hypothetical protein
MGDDPLNRRFGDDWGRLTKDLLFDGDGSLKFKAHLWSDIRKVILPTLVNKVSGLQRPCIDFLNAFGRLAIFPFHGSSTPTKLSILCSRT